MTQTKQLEIFLTTVPGFEEVLREEAIEKGFNNPECSVGGVTVWGNWKEVWRANLEIRGASRVFVRLGTFPANHLAKLDKKARNFPWGDTLLYDVPVRVEVTCKKSRIYHHKAAAERIEKAIYQDFGAEISDNADVCLKVRIFNDQVTISVDTSGTGLHKRGHKEAVNKAPLRETIAALMLRHAGYDGREPVLDPMCGSGTFIIEAAEIAKGLTAGRSRHFAFEKLATFSKDSFQYVKSKSTSKPPSKSSSESMDISFYGFDRDMGAIDMSRANAERASVRENCSFTCQSISDLSAPEGDKGLVVINPPYGGRIGDEHKLLPLYQTMGKVLKANFQGWRVAIITSSDKLAGSTGLPFDADPLAFSHGGIKVKLHKTTPLS